jgi:hypothetical protein
LAIPVKEKNEVELNESGEPVEDKPMDYYEILMQQLSTVLTRDG